MYPHERSLVEEMKSRPFALIGVNSDSNLEKIRKVVEEKNLPWRSFWNGGSTDGPISTAWNVSGWPMIYVLDADGRIHYRGHSGDEAIAKVHELVTALEKKSAADGTGDGGPR